MTRSVLVPPTRWPWLGLALLLWGTDQAIKYAVTQWMQLFESRSVFNGFNWVYVLNPGAAFSFLADAGGWQRDFFTAIAFLVSTVLVVLLWRGVATKLEALAYTLMIAGALGNATDRMRIGAVVDYLDVYWRAWHWPAFNFADICVSVAALLLVLGPMRQGGQTHASERKSHAA
ncbi:lipoprotein signal peptidase [Comamonadaceae bacterium OS-1]|nr:lipoprotein signal peptidase [Comamonadaceae bacterium OS-1]